QEVSWSQPVVLSTAVGFLSLYFSHQNWAVSQTSLEEKVEPSSHLTPERSFQVTHILAAVSLQPLVLTSPLAVVGTSVARSGRQKSAWVLALAVSSVERYQRSPSLMRASTAYE